MSNLRELERKVDLLIKFVTCLESEHKDSLMQDLEALKEEVSEKGKPLKYIVEDFLTEFGVPSNILGYSYLVTAVCTIIENPHMGTSVTKHLYPEVAKVHDSTPSRVERAIRHAIESTVYRVNDNIIHEVFKNSMLGKKKPTNTEFIFRVVQVIQRDLEERNSAT